MMVENSDTFETVAGDGPREVQSDSSSVGNRATAEEPRRRLSNPSLGLRNIASNNPELQQLVTVTAAKIDSVKKWTMSTYKNTKHLCMEHMGKVEKTADKELDEMIGGLRELRKCYREILSTVQHFNNYMALANNMQRNMASAFGELAARETTLSKELNMQSEIFGIMAQNMELLNKSFAHIVSSLQTMSDKTIEDTFMTIEHLDQARLEFDVCRQELKDIRENPSNNSTKTLGLDEMCNQKRAKYEQLREDVRTKLVLLEENRCKVMREQIAQIQKAFGVLFTENAQAVERTVSELTKLGVPTDAVSGNSSLPTNMANSFLEK